MLLIFTWITPADAQTCIQTPPGIVSWWPGDGDAADILEGYNTLVVNLGSRFTNDLIIPTPLSVGTWTHLALTFDYSTDTYQLYVNGFMEASTTSSYASPTQALRIGAATSDFGQNFWFNGGLDEVTVYDRALAASEI